MDLIRDVSGQVAYEEEASRVKPIDAFGEDLGIREASTSLVFNHLNSFSDHKVIRQRHQVQSYGCISFKIYINLPISWVTGSNSTCHQSHLWMERQSACVLCLRLREQNIPSQVPAKVLLGLPDPLNQQTRPNNTPSLPLGEETQSVQIDWLFFERKLLKAAVEQSLSYKKECVCENVIKYDYNCFVRCLQKRTVSHPLCFHRLWIYITWLKDKMFIA